PFTSSPVEPYHLFNELDLSRVLDAREGQLKHSVEQVQRSEYQAHSDEELIKKVLQQNHVEPLELLEGAIGVSSEEVQVDVRYRAGFAVGGWGNPMRAGFRITYFVPFTGDPTLFRCQPSTYTSNSPYALVHDSEVRFRFDVLESEVASTKSEFENQMRLLKEWMAWVNEDVSRYDQRAKVVAAGAIAERRQRLQKADDGLAALGLPVRTTPPKAAARHVETSDARRPKRRRYDVALSFAGEDRAYVEQVASDLAASGVDVFYDKFEKVDLWGKNLVDHLADVYRKGTRFVVMFVSSHYVNKAWPIHERRHAQARALLTNEEYILPARFDDSEVPGLPETTAFVDLRSMQPNDLAALIRKKIRHDPAAYHS
ncbi:MAG: TIR domain-containing protein, partial [Gemmatimonadota bacterium]